MDNALEYHIQTLVEYIYQLAPEVQVEPTSAIYEDEHANLDVYPPLTWSEDGCLTLQHRISERTVDMLVDSGYFVLVYVYTPAQQIELARYKLAQAKQQWESTNRFLDQAASLGILQGTAPVMV